MFSIEYFKYLFKSKKYLLLIIALVTLLNVFIDSKEASIVLQSLLSAGLLFVLPVMVFYYVHDKKAVDTFFSIPVSRKEMLITNMVFIVSTIAIPQLLSMIVYGIFKGISLGSVVLYCLEALLAVCAIASFNSMLFLLANNIIDGIIVIGAYTFLPLSLLITLDTFLRTFVAGINSFKLSFIGYLSPIFMGFDVISEYLRKGQHFINHNIALIIVLIVSAVVLYRNYVNRKVERANTLTTKLATYPLIMTIYLFMVLLLLSTAYGFSYVGLDGTIHFIKDQIVLYIVLFAIFVSAYFIYKRQLSFNYKLPILFIVAALITLLFAQSAKTTRGFGLSDKYIKNEPHTQYSVNLWQDKNYGGSNNKVIDYFAKKLDYTPSYINVNVLVGVERTRVEISQKCLDFLEKTRLAAIDYYYSNDKDYSDSVGNMYVESKQNKDLETYSYTLKGVDLDELMSLVNEPYVTISVQTDKAEYSVDKNGELIVTYLYE